MYAEKQKDFYFITDINKYNLFFAYSKFLHQNKSMVFLTGDIGAGKTTFVKKFISMLDSKRNAYSPTFSIMNDYQINGRQIFHYDLYRVQNTRELQEIGLDFHLQKNAIHFIEWPNNFREFLPKPNFEIVFQDLDGFRLLTIEYEK